MFKFGASSKRELAGVFPDLVEAVQLALELTPVDFGVHDGIRTRAEQLEYVRSGVSTTMNSKHLVQPDGYGHAVDLVPYINGRLRWEWQPIFLIAEAMHEAVNLIGVRVRWGACWDRCFNDLDRTNLEGEVGAYRQRRLTEGARVFLDGPHYETLEAS